jgi:HlyD family secretion protein
MSKKSLLIATVAALAILSATWIFARAPKTASASQPITTATSDALLVSGPGRVEPCTEDVKLGSELSGKLREVKVEEGDRVHRGQVLAILENDDYLAQVRSAEADVLAKEATLRKVVNGARHQERQEALSTVRAQQAVMDNSRAQADRYQKVFDAGVVSKEEAERYSREYEVAKANYQEATEHHSLVDDKAREEDQALADANLQLSRAQLAEARARYEKTLIKSPIDGIVLRKHHRNGESVSNSSTVPDPILTVGDKTILRVRIDVDETEVSKVRVGQKAYVTADAYGQQKFWGQVIRVGEQLGRKNVRTDEPTERVDTKILETLVELQPGTQLPVGLRVDGFVETGVQ